MASAGSPDAPPQADARPVQYNLRLLDVADPAQALFDLVLATTGHSLVWAYARTRGQAAAIHFSTVQQARSSSATARTWRCPGYLG